MGKALQATSRDPADTGIGSVLTRFWPLAFNYHQSTAAGATESNGQITCRTAGTVSNLQVVVKTNSLNGTSTFTSRKSGAGGAMSITVNATITGRQSDLSNTDTLALTNTYGLSLVTAGSSGTMLHTSETATFSATANHAVVFGGGSFKTQSTTASTTFFGMLAGGNGNLTATETDAQLETDVAGTIQNLQVIVSTARTTNTTVTSRIGAGAGAQTVTLTASTPGLYEDTTHTDTLAATNLFNVAFANGTGTTGPVYPSVSVLFINTTNKKNNIFVGFNTSTTASYVRTASATTSFVPPAGAFAVDDTVEADVKVEHNFAVTNADMRVNVSANAYTGTCTMASSKNGSAGSQTISILTLATGFKTDTTHSDSLNGTDDFTYSFVGGTANTITLMSAGSFDTVVVSVNTGDFTLFF